MIFILPDDKAAFISIEKNLDNLDLEDIRWNLPKKCIVSIPKYIFVAVI
jgi:hypothetical protein